MTKKKLNIDRGAILAVAVQKSRMIKEAAANRAGYTRSAYYKHIKQPRLDTHILSRYGIALSYDFADEIPDMAAFSLQDSGNDEPTTLDEALRQLNLVRRRLQDSVERENEVRSKYTDLLEGNLVGWLVKTKGTKRKL